MYSACSFVSSLSRAPERGQMEPGDLLVEFLRQPVHRIVVVRPSGPQLDLSEDLVGERGAHDERGMPGGVAEVEQSTLGEDEDLRRLPSESGLRRHGDGPFVDLRFDLDDAHPVDAAQAGEVDLVVEVADVADDRSRFEARRTSTSTTRVLPVVVMTMSATSATSGRRATW